MKFPDSPVEVHKMLCDRQELIEKTLHMKEMENAPICMHEKCKKCASKVCRNCKKLVLCEKHCEDQTPCPICGNPIKVV